MVPPLEADVAQAGRGAEKSGPVAERDAVSAGQCDPGRIQVFCRPRGEPLRTGEIRDQRDSQQVPQEAQAGEVVSNKPEICAILSKHRNQLP